MKTFDLRECSGCAEQAFLQKFGRVPNFKKLESIFNGVKGTKKSLSYYMIKNMTKQKYWNFKDFWMIPDLLNLMRKLKKTKGIFKNIPEEERETITILYDIFKNIEVVSIILRFVGPQDYGIISPPVRYALKQLPSENYIDEYINYLSTIRSYVEEYDFKRAADADIALWALVEKCLISGNSSCQNYKKYQERIVEIEEEMLNANQHYQEMQDKLVSVVAQEESLRIGEKEKLKEEVDKYKNKYEDLCKKRNLMLDLIELKKSNLLPEEKIIHDKKEPFLDSGHEHFMRRIAKNEYIHKIIWSENISSKLPIRISHVERSGELTILYVTKDNYAAKIKVLPCDCPDKTHAKYFANLISKYMNIPNWCKGD